MEHFKYKEQHESYGLLQISRTTCHPPANLFGSSISHSSLIILRIKRAEKSRDLSRDWYFGREMLIEIEMSNTQFAEAITSMNMGSGVPVTLTYVDKQRMEPCPEIHKRQEIEREFRKTCKGIAAKTQQAASEARMILAGSGTLKKEDRQRLSDLIFMIQQDISSSLPFVNKSFDEQLDKTIMEAKGECEAFYTNAVHKLGLEALSEKAPKLVGYEGEGEEDSDD